MVLKVVSQGRKRDIAIKEGEVSAICSELLSKNLFVEKKNFVGNLTFGDTRLNVVEKHKHIQNYVYKTLYNNKFKCL